MTSGHYRFLIVDDNPVDRLICRRLLMMELAAEDIEEVDSGPAALDWLAENRGRSDPALVILLDIRMPEMDGFEFVDAYANRAEIAPNRDTRIFMLSSSLDSSDRKRADQNPLIECLLTKPFKPEELAQYLSS